MNLYLMNHQKMKERQSRFIILLLLFSVTSFDGKGQDKLSIGIQGGFVSSTVKGDQIHFGLLHEHKQSFSGGILLQYKFSNRFGIATSINYQNLGPKFVDDPADGNETPTMDINVNADFAYINVPVTISYSILKNNWLYAHVGFSSNFLLSATMKGEAIDWFQPKFYFNYDYTESFRKVEFAFVGGIGSNIQILEKVALNLNFSFNRAILSTNKKNENSEIKFYNQYISFMTGVTYSF